MAAALRQKCAGSSCLITIRCQLLSTKPTRSVNCCFFVHNEMTAIVNQTRAWQLLLLITHWLLLFITDWQLSTAAAAATRVAGG
jgi:hypothetical protein